MPKIQAYQRQQSIPGEAANVPMNIGSAGVVGAAIESFGDTGVKAASSISDSINRRKASLRRQDIANKTLIAGAAYDDEEREYEQSERQLKGQDAYENIERGKKFRDASIEKYTADITDPELKLKIENHIRARSNGLLDSLAVHQATQREYVTKQAIENMQAGILKDAYAGKDLGDSINRFREAVKEQYEAGSRGAEQSVDFMMKGEAAIAEAYLDGIINRNPTAGIAEIQSGKYNQFLPQKKIEGYDNKAKTLQNAIIQDFKEQRREEERLKKEELKLKRDEIGNDFVDKIVSGKLTRADVVKSSLEPTGENSKQYWLNQIEAGEKRSAEGTFKTDKVTEANLFTRIVKDPESVSESEILDAMNAGKLSKTSTNSLLAEKKQRLNPQKDPVRMAAEAAITENLKRDRKAGIFGKEQAGDLEYAKQVDAFRRWSKAHPSDDPSEYYEKVMEPVRKSYLWGLFNTTAQDPKAKREAMIVAGEIPQRRATDRQNVPAAAETRSINNNPLNIKLGGFTQRYVDSGIAEVGRKAKDKGNFLNFKTQEDGINAAKELLQSPVYSNLTVDSAMKKWSNNGYGGNIAPSLAKKKMSSLSDTEINTLMSAMIKHEGSSSSGATDKKPDYGYGNRADGTPKGKGFLGELKRPDGKVSTELSIGVTMDGKETEIPALVPTLTKKEIDSLLSGEKPSKTIIDKAVSHAKERIKQGKSPFAQAGEGKKQIGTQNGKPVYDLGNGKWQVGD
jgi:predicted transcriptional regulator